MSTTGEAPLRAEHAVAYSYRRSAAGAVGTFLAGLARGEILGARTGNGRVVVPPVDADPATGRPISDVVPVGPAGTVRSWTWVDPPLPEHPLDRPFAFVLVQLDGADTSLLHVVDAPDVGAMATGMRVRADWRADRTGSIADIRAFVPGRAGGATGGAGRATGEPAPVDPPAELAVVSDVRLTYAYEPGLVQTAFLRALGERRIEGGRCPTCRKVYVPPRLRCPACGTGPMEPLAVDDRGTVVAYTVIHVPPPGSDAELPFAWASIRLDGTDVPFPHLLGEVAMADIRVGQRVEAVWVDDEELAPTWESIRHFRPVEP